jgi:hypothetical protein
MFFHADYCECDYSRELHFHSSLFFLWEFCLYCFINAFVVSVLIRNHMEHSYYGIAWNSLLLYNHALSNTNIVCLSFDRRERSRSSQWVRAVGMGIDCWQERRFCVFARAVYRLRFLNGANRPEGEDTKLHLMLWCRMFRAVSSFPFVPTKWCH